MKLQIELTNGTAGRAARAGRWDLVHRIDEESLEVLTLLTEASYRAKRQDRSLRSA
jgi:hypothetical protein